jgi:CheY-like chemotaxis protein
VARIVALVPDLMFGSRVQAALTGAGHDVALVATAPDARARVDRADVLVVDLAQPDTAGVDLVAGLSAGERAGERAGVRTLAYYAHVDQATRRRAEEAGFDLVVPRSRMAREGPALVARLLAGGEQGNRAEA